MRDDLEPVERPPAAQHPAPQHDQPAVLEHPHLAAVLGLVRRRRLLERLRLGLVDRAPAALHHQIRQRQVVPEARVDLDVVLAAQRVDRAVAAGDRAELRLGHAHRELVAPVDALLVRAVGARCAAARRRRPRPGRRTPARAGGEGHAVLLTHSENASEKPRARGPRPGPHPPCRQHADRLAGSPSLPKRAGGSPGSHSGSGEAITRS